MKTPLATMTLALALALAGCTAPVDDATASSTASASASTSPVTRDTVDKELRAAIQQAGLDPAKGMTTAERNGKKHPGLVDWIATIPTAEAEQALPKIGAELERNGWKAEPPIDSVLRYKKSGWRLLASSFGSSKMPTLAEGSSMVQLNASDLTDAG
ncbi:hypothetical protein [Streptomyces sp. NPDC059874]|uniref:hypothetical protein n=1 Tax=Streptomyces sp. NPDC059874 TaxID=3346983 RepID=UPI0036685591